MPPPPNLAGSTDGLSSEGRHHPQDMDEGCSEATELAEFMLRTESVSAEDLLRDGVLVGQVGASSYIADFLFDPATASRNRLRALRWKYRDHDPSEGIIREIVDMYRFAVADHVSSARFREGQKRMLGHEVPLTPLDALHLLQQLGDVPREHLAACEGCLSGLDPAEEGAVAFATMVATVRAAPEVLSCIRLVLSFVWMAEPARALSKLTDALSYASTLRSATPNTYAFLRSTLVTHALLFQGCFDPPTHLDQELAALAKLREDDVLQDKEYTALCRMFIFPRGAPESDSELADRLRKMGEDGVLQAQVVEDIINSCGKTEGLRDEEAEVLFQEMLQAFKGEEEEKVRSLAAGLGGPLLGAFLRRLYRHHLQDREEASALADLVVVGQDAVGKPVLDYLFELWASPQDKPSCVSVGPRFNGKELEGHLEALWQLRQSEAITDADFTKAKADLLGDSPEKVTYEDLVGVLEELVGHRTKGDITEEDYLVQKYDFIHSGEAFGVPDGDSLVMTLERMWQLRKNGYLTADDYESLKKGVLFGGGSPDQLPQAKRISVAQGLVLMRRSELMKEEELIRGLRELEVSPPNLRSEAPQGAQQAMEALSRLKSLGVLPDDFAERVESRLGLRGTDVWSVLRRVEVSGLLSDEELQKAKAKLDELQEVKMQLQPPVVSKLEVLQQKLASGQITVL